MKVESLTGRIGQTNFKSNSTRKNSCPKGTCAGLNTEIPFKGSTGGDSVSFKSKLEPVFENVIGAVISKDPVAVRAIAKKGKLIFDKKQLNVLGLELKGAPDSLKKTVEKAFDIKIPIPTSA